MDTIQERIVRQAQAMGSEVFEVGLYKPSPVGAVRFPEMLLRTWDVEMLIRSISWLKSQNAGGRNIYIRPKGEHSLSLVDDLTSQAVERMKRTGFTPALIVETSLDNFQAWLNHGRVLPKEVSTTAARMLAEKFGGDPGSADWRHFGRLCAFANLKEKHRQPHGHYPVVRLVHSTGEVYAQALQFIASVEAQIAQARVESLQRRSRFLTHQPTEHNRPLKTISDFRCDPRYQADGNRIDLAYAIYALAHGVPDEEVRRSIASRDLHKKGPLDRQLDYINRTVQKALEAAAREGSHSR
jgi:hypothetical protein